MHINIHIQCTCICTYMYRHYPYLIGSPRKPLISRSISSDGETFTGRDTEKMKLHLQRRIESRKPPSLFDTPVTPPLFHQVNVCMY